MMSGASAPHIPPKTEVKQNATVCLISDDANARPRPRLTSHADVARSVPCRPQPFCPLPFAVALTSTLSAYAPRVERPIGAASSSDMAPMRGAR